MAKRNEQYLTISQAATRVGCSEDTIRRRLRAKAIPGARRSGPNWFDEWLIPVSGLTAAGLDPDTEPSEQTPAHQANSDSYITRLENELQALRSHNQILMDVVAKLVGGAAA